MYPSTYLVGWIPHPTKKPNGLFLPSSVFSISFFKGALVLEFLHYFLYLKNKPLYWKGGFFPLQPVTFLISGQISFKDYVSKESPCNFLSSTHSQLPLPGLCTWALSRLLKRPPPSGLLRGICRKRWLLPHEYIHFWTPYLLLLLPSSPFLHSFKENSSMLVQCRCFHGLVAGTASLSLHII